MKQLALLVTLTLGISSATFAIDGDHDQLAQTNNQYGRLTAHCPKSAELRNILREHKEDVEAKRNFTFFCQDRLWETSYIQTYTDMSFDDIVGTLRLAYDCNNTPTSALAQFIDRGINALCFNIEIMTPQKMA